MWCEVLENNEFLKSLYTKVPDLKEVYISSLGICDIKKNFSISFYMPRFADRPLEKWNKYPYNTIFVGIKLNGIHKVMIKSERKDYRGDIEIYKDELGLITLNVTGTLQALIKAEVASIFFVEERITKRPCEVDCQCCCDLR